MNVLRLFRDDRSVSPVISVILMVAVTVILAATIAVFVLDIGESTSTDPPQAGFTAEQKVMRLTATGGYQGDFYVLQIVYQSGDPIPEDQLNIRVDGQQAWGVSNDTAHTGNSLGYAHEAKPLLDGTSSSSFSSGQSITVVHTDDPRITINEGDKYVLNQPGNPNNVNPITVDNDPEKNRLFHAPNAPFRGPPSPQLQLTPEDRVTITWQSKRGDKTAVLFEREIDSFD